MLLYLRFPSCYPSLDALWSNLAETRRVRRRLTGPTLEDGKQYASFFGWDDTRRRREVVILRLRERLVERLIEKRDKEREHN